VHSRVTSKKSHLAVRRRWVGALGAGPTFSKPKIVTQVSLGPRLHILDTHLLASITWSEEKFVREARRRKKSVRLARLEYRARQRHCRDHIAKLVDLALSLEGDVLICGDLNSDRDFGPIQPLRDIVEPGSWTKDPTFHADNPKRVLDHVLLKRSATARQASQRVVRTKSDHRSPIVVVETV
jgi:endonuclease/exonuclease/phosphatase family metal-dependent hydrolase